MKTTAAAAALAAVLPALASAASYPILDSMKGANFLDGWNFPVSTYDNTTNGDVFWATPQNTSLLYLNDAGRFVLKVDNTTFVPYNEKRYAPTLFSKKAYNSGTVIVFDATHMPYGCSVWPAFWTQGANWPHGGEIDIVEGINQQTKNQIALHTGQVCTQSKSQFTGTPGFDNCTIGANYDAGCVVTDPSENSYGAGFAAAGGGVFVTEWTDQFIKIWFFSRANVPSSLTADAKSIDTGSFGTPVAWYDSSTCDLKNSLSAQTITLTTTLCGSWAGVASTLEQTCPPLTGTNTCYTQYVINDASETYKNAYFEINYVNVFSSASYEINNSSAAQSHAAPGGSKGGDNSTAGASAGASGSGSSAAPSSSGKGSWARPVLDTSVGYLAWGAVAAAGIASGMAVVF
ncbi:hypothetical protein Q8F55_005868 [Vanrija albida]|uniref:GH16 domain-containing protein n=1 Tax=Vanrija albida TaxID=181172 RepID=A0ABR3Q2S3_9TREE